MVINYFYWNTFTWIYIYGCIVTNIGKGNKERTNYLNDITKEALLKYLNIRDNSHDKGRNNPLFLTDYGFRMSVTTIKKIVKRAYRKANLDENIYSVHTLRHTCATILYKAGVILEQYKTN